MSERISARLVRDLRPLLEYLHEGGVVPHGLDAVDD